jgi:hypothetical protein
VLGALGTAAIVATLIGWRVGWKPAGAAAVRLLEWSLGWTAVLALRTWPLLAFVLLAALTSPWVH